MALIDDLARRIERGKASDRELARIAGQTIAEMDADTRAPDPVGCECNGGTLGRSPEGDLVFCHCISGLEEQMSHYLSLLDSYAEAMQRYDLGKRLGWLVMLFSAATRQTLEVEYKIASDLHDEAERRWYALQGKTLPDGLAA